MNQSQRLGLLGGMINATNFFGPDFPSGIFRRLLQEEADARPTDDPLGAKLREMAEEWDAARFLQWRERHGDGRGRDAQK